MKKRHEILALLAAAAGLSMGAAAEASIVTQMHKDTAEPVSDDPSG
jgi:hypothetical protein